MSEMMDAMRAAQPDKNHPKDAKVCRLCSGKGWLMLEFQAEVCSEKRPTNQSRECKECNETGIMADHRFAMLALQPKKSNDDWKPCPTDDKNFMIHGRCGITFPKTYYWTGLDWLEYDNPFYLEAKRAGRVK